MYVPLDITALSNSVAVYIGGEVPDIMGILLYDNTPDGPIHVMATPTDETLDKSALSSTIHVRVTSSPKAMGLFKLLVTVAMVGLGTAYGTQANEYIMIQEVTNILHTSIVLVFMIHAHIKHHRHTLFGELK